MPNKIAGDREIGNALSTKNKALRINLNENIYGTFAEIGAGQETVRHFFRAAEPSRTIAKAMSAYDKDFSDSIYGLDPQGRYVTEGRLKAMLEYETFLIEKRLPREKHIQFHETSAVLQQITLGILGVNLIYGGFYLYDKPIELLRSLYDNLDTHRIEIDTINFLGPLFEAVDNRLMSLQLVKNGMTEAVMFAPDGNNVLAANILYKKNILTLRGSFRPVTKVHMSMYEKSLELFLKEKKVDKEKTVVIFEITLSNLKAEGEIDEKDFLDRADLLCALGQTVMISNFQEYYKVVEYFSLHTKERMGLTMGVTTFIDIFDEKYYRHLSGGILEAFGKLFFKDLKIYLYPLKENGEVITSRNLKLHPRMKELYKYFRDNGRVVDITDFDPEILDIDSRAVHHMIVDGVPGWEGSLPPSTAAMIKEKNLFQNK